jgi:hypothetical protein
VAGGGLNSLRSTGSPSAGSSAPSTAARCAARGCLAFSACHLAMKPGSQGMLEELSANCITGHSAAVGASYCGSMVEPPASV